MLKRRLKICASIGIRNVEMLNEKIKEAFNLGSDLFEVRVDYLSEINFTIMKEAIKNYVDKCILTCRAKSEGGEFNGSEKERQEVLFNLSKLKPAYMDIELSFAQKNPEFLNLIKSLGISIILSWHNFEYTPSSQFLKDTFDKAKSLGDIVKIVTMAKDFSDNITILNLYKYSKPNKLIAFCMGEKGQISRILCPIL
ncbi:MAG: type I 3-dehydroquinate dehydratase, partial [Nitrososphaerales archaeon]